MTSDLSADLTGYAALIGEGFQSRVDLLERLLRSRHYPSLGSYKERLLADTIRSFLPSTVSVGSGFVLFPCSIAEPPAGGAYYDKLNQSAFDVSRQCDVIVYDAQNYPPVFRDGDFVVLRPESVRAVVEVKGSGTRSEINGMLESFLDFGRKWQCTQQFYKEHHQGLSADPQLHCFCWSAPSLKRKDLGQVLREQVSIFYKNNVRLEQFGALPMLYSLMVYNEWEVSEVQGIGDEGAGRPAQMGWHSRRGRFLRVGEDNKLYLDKDRTVASLLSKLHWIVAKDQFNRFFSYPDEVRSQKDNVLEQSGVTWAWETKQIEPIRRRNLGQLPD